MIWHVLNHGQNWNSETARSIFESTLDSASQTWCVHQYPVSNYILAARADIVEAGVAPVEVMQYQIPEPDKGFFTLRGSEGNGAAAIFYPGDALTAGNTASTIAALKLFRTKGDAVELPAEWLDCGAMAYCLGRVDLARERAARVTEMLNLTIRTHLAEKLIVDGPLTQWMLETIYPQLDPEFKVQARVESLLDRFFHPNPLLNLSTMNVKRNEPLWVYALASEFTRLVEGGCASFKSALASIPGLQVIEPPDGMELGASSGAGGGLYVSFPELSERVSKARVAEAINKKTTCIVTDSPLDAEQLKYAAGITINVSTPVELLADLVKESHLE